jgi:CarD family transcriptional regulator
MIYELCWCSPAQHSLVDPSLTIHRDTTRIQSFFEKCVVVLCLFVLSGLAWCEGKIAMSDVKKAIFSVGDFVVYPAHGVGRVTGVEVQLVAGMSLEVFVIAFDQDKMTLRVPTSKVKIGGLRALSGPAIMDDALKTLTGRARIKRAMWSRRAQEYEAKINSGDLISIAEVVRDLHRATDQPEQSYSERQLYESALDRMAREVAAVESLNRDEAIKKLTSTLATRAA